VVAIAEAPVKLDPDPKVFSTEAALLSGSGQADGAVRAY